MSSPYGICASPLGEKSLNTSLLKLEAEFHAARAERRGKNDAVNIFAVS
jgi:hypothetical protein